MQAKNFLVLHVLCPNSAEALRHGTVQSYIKRPEDLHPQRKSPQLPCPCPVEEASSKSENVTAFSVIFVVNVIASCKIFSSLCLFASLLAAWFALKIELCF